MTHIEQRYDTAANWTSVNPVLRAGEVGWESDTEKSKLGDGVTPWNGLDYATSPGGAVSSVAGKTGAVTLNKGDVGLGNVNNTPDSEKPVSIAQQAALNTKADLASPVFTGNPTAPTPAASDDDDSIATTGFVKDTYEAVPRSQLVVFSATGTFAKANYIGAKAVRVRVVGGGGGGGGCSAAAAGQHAKGGGGGAGGYAERIIAVADLALTETVTVGAGGTAGSTAGPTGGGQGATTSFGNFVAASGGLGGTYGSGSTAAFAVAGGSGGAGTTGTFRTSGGAGGYGFGDGALGASGQGGDSLLGGGAPARSTASAGASLAGLVGSGYGGGGSGGLSTSAGAAAVGGAGAGGVVLIEVLY